jgi:hypothetical protein
LPKASLRLVRWRRVEIFLSVGKKSLRKKNIFFCRISFFRSFGENNYFLAKLILARARGSASYVSKAFLKVPWPAPGLSDQMIFRACFRPSGLALISSVRTKFLARARGRANTVRGRGGVARHARQSLTRQGDGLGVQPSAQHRSRALRGKADPPSGLSSVYYLGCCELII